MVLIKGNKRTFRRSLEKVTITTCDTSQTTMDGERGTNTINTRGAFISIWSYIVELSKPQTDDHILACSKGALNYGS